MSADLLCAGCGHSDYVHDLLSTRRLTAPGLGMCERCSCQRFDLGEVGVE